MLQNGQGEQPVTCGRAEQKLATVGHKNVDIHTSFLLHFL